MDGPQDPMTVEQWHALHPGHVPNVPPDVLERHRALGPDGFTLEVVAAPRGEPSMIARAPDGTPLQMGKPLRKCREEFGGDEGLVTHPFTGEMLSVSLRPWADADPDDTFVLVRFVHHHMTD
jgi:hypothetical protein